MRESGNYDFSIPNNNIRCIFGRMVSNEFILFLDLTYKRSLSTKVCIRNKGNVYYQENGYRWDLDGNFFEPKKKKMNKYLNEKLYPRK